MEFPGGAGEPGPATRVFSAGANLIEFPGGAGEPGPARTGLTDEGANLIEFPGGAGEPGPATKVTCDAEANLIEFPGGAGEPGPAKTSVEVATKAMAINTCATETNTFFMRNSLLISNLGKE
jgi:hypothetical protein